MTDPTEVVWVTYLEKQVCKGIVSLVPMNNKIIYKGGEITQPFFDTNGLKNGQFVYIECIVRINPYRNEIRLNDKNKVNLHFPKIIEPEDLFSWKGFNK